MKQFEINELSNLLKEDFANLFNVYQNKEHKYFYNINRGLFLKNLDEMAPGYFSQYEIKYKDTWPLISYKIYGTIELWWLVCKANNILDPTFDPVVGENIQILNREVVDSILAQTKSG